MSEIRERVAEIILTARGGPHGTSIAGCEEPAEHPDYAAADAILALIRDAGPTGAPTLFVIRCSRCDALDGTPAGKAPCVKSTDGDHDWSDVDEWSEHAPDYAEPPC